MAEITSIHLPVPIEWSTKKADAEKHVTQILEEVLNKGQNRRNYIGALGEVSRERSPNRSETASYWLPYLYGEKTLSDFFEEWLTYTPTPKSPGMYIEYWDYLVNTNSGLKLEENEEFKVWFSQFLNFHGDWINSTSSTTTLESWMKYKGTQEHPFNIEDYQIPDPKSPTGGFQSFNQFFLRNLKEGERPLCSKPDALVVVPSDGGIFYLDRGGDIEQARQKRHDLLGKYDQFGLLDALPGYGEYFLGGPLMNILLWFTDYHHFHAPVSGTVISQGLYKGSYNYDFGDYDPQEFYAPDLSPQSDRVGWYQKLGKHQRYVWIIRTEHIGLVAMIAIGFWGVGSIVNHLKLNQTIEKGQYMGHFGYGGSSIVLAFPPELDVNFNIDGKALRGADYPTLVKARQCLG